MLLALFPTAYKMIHRCPQTVLLLSRAHYDTSKLKSENKYYEAQKPPPSLILLEDFNHLLSISIPLLPEFILFALLYFFYEQMSALKYPFDPHF